MKKHIKQHILFLSISLLLLSVISIQLRSQQEAPITLEKVAGEVYCLYGPGCNIGIFKAEDVFLLVDSKYARTADKVMEEIMKLGSQKIKFLINTHYHQDHTGGNSILGKDAQIISHKNCRSSLLKSLKPEETAENVGAPQKTYEKEMTLELGEETIKLLYFGPGHTSGDTVVIFEKAKVIHAGDLFFHGMPPYIDVKDGSDTLNWILTIEKLAKEYPDYTVIPGHGKVTEMKEYVKFADYLKYLREKVAAAVKAGKTREQAQESITFEKFSHINDWGTFLTKKENVGWVYDEMTRKQK